MKIDDYSFGTIIVNGVTYDTDVILLPDRLMENWWRVEGHLLLPADMKEVIESKPEIFIIGRGMYNQLKVSAETHELLQAHGIDLVERNSKRACADYNSLSQTSRVAAGIHLTC